MYCLPQKRHLRKRRYELTALLTDATEAAAAFIPNPECLYNQVAQHLNLDPIRCPPIFTLPTDNSTYLEFLSEPLPLSAMLSMSLSSPPLTLPPNITPLQSPKSAAVPTMQSPAMSLEGSNSGSRTSLNDTKPTIRQTTTRLICVQGPNRDIRLEVLYLQNIGINIQFCTTEDDEVNHKAGEQFADLLARRCDITAKMIPECRIRKSGGHIHCHCKYCKCSCGHGMPALGVATKDNVKTATDKATD